MLFTLPLVGRVGRKATGVGVVAVSIEGPHPLRLS